MMNRDRILNCARNMFFSYGLKSITMDSIASELHVSKKTLYANYNSKEAIVSKVASRFLKAHIKECEKISKQSENAIAELLSMTKDMTEIFYWLRPGVIFEMQKYFPAVWSQFADFRENFLLKKVKANITRGKHEGIYLKDLDADIMAQLLLIDFQIASDIRIFPLDKYEYQRIYENFIRCYIRGISTNRGHRFFLKLSEASASR